MKKIIILVAFTLPALCSIGAQAELSANLALSSNYVFNGISYSNGNPAVQGGVDWLSDTGFYLGTWATSIDYKPFGYRDAKTEVDYYGGFAGEFSEQAEYDLGLRFYTYPGIDDGQLESDYYEVYGALTLYKNTTVSVFYSPDYSAEAGRSLILLANHKIQLPYEVTLDLEGGYTKLLDNSSYLDADDVVQSSYQDSYWFGKDHYSYWGVGLSRNVFGFDTSLKYSDTDVNEQNDPDKIAGSQVSYTVSRTF